MAYLRRQPINSSCIVGLSKLSSDVVRLRLQALNLPKVCSRMRLLRTLRFVRTSYFSYRARSKNFRTSSGRITKASRLSSAGQRKQLANRRADGKFTAQSSFTLKQSVSPQERQNCPVIPGSSVDDLLKSQVALSVTKNTVISPAQLFAVQETTSSSIKGVFPSPSFHDSHLGGVARPRTHSHRTSSVAPPLDIEYKVDGDEIFRETRANSQVTVAAQQRAEAAYRRQRMAQEREQTAVLRAEMEVERARMLKEMTCGSRRPSYCIELENLKEETPDDVRKNLEECLKDYSAVEAKNARNSLPNGYPRPAVIMRSESREEKVEQQNTQVQVRENDENGNKDRRNSTAENSDKDACITEKQQSLQTVKDRSTQASPSNVCIEENEQTRQHSGNEQTRLHSGDEQARGNSEDEQTRDNSGNEQIRVHSGKDDETLVENAGEMDRSGKPKKNEDVSIVHNSYTSHDQTVEKPENDFKDVTTIANYDSAAMTHEQSTTHDENLNKITNSDGSEPIRDTTKNVNYLGSDTEPVKVADNFNEEHTSLQANEAAEDSQQQQQQQQQNHIERGENAANGSEQSQTVVKGSTDQDPETMQSSHANVTQSNDDEKVTTENEQIDQPRETTLE